MHGLLQLAVGFADALSDLRARALILVAPAVLKSRLLCKSGGEGEGHNHG